MDNIPEEIAENILSKLDQKSLHTWMCLCKNNLKYIYVICKNHYVRPSFVPKDMYEMCRFLRVIDEDDNELVGFFINKVDVDYKSYVSKYPTHYYRRSKN